MDPAWITAITALAVALAALGAWGGRWGVRLLIATHDFLTDWPKMKTAITGTATKRSVDSSAPSWIAITIPPTHMMGAMTIIVRAI